MQHYSSFNLENVITPVRVDVFEKLLRDSAYPDDEIDFLTQGFRNGFDIGYQGPENRKSLSDNIPFSVGNRVILWNKLMKEVKENRVTGPFDSIPFDSFIQSPIGLVPKASGDQTRLIFHLSFDFSEKEEDKFLNHFTLAETCSVHYHDLYHAVEVCLRVFKQSQTQQKTHPHLFLAKSDLRSAFRILPLCHRSWPYLVMKAVNPSMGVTQFFVDKCLPFGASISCSHFQHFSNTLRHILEHVTARQQFTNYLDDFLFVADSAELCNCLVRAFLNLCQQIVFPVSDEKLNGLKTTWFSWEFCWKVYQ